MGPTGEKEISYVLPYFGLKVDNYFTKIIFGVKIEIGIFEISNLPNFNKFWAFFYSATNLSLTICKYFTKIIFDIKIECGMLEILDVPNFN